MLLFEYLGRIFEILTLVLVYANIIMQKWKAFAAQVEEMTKALKKKDTAKAKAIFDGPARAALDDYLEKVELPPSKEM